MPRPQTLRQVLIWMGLTLCCISDGYIFGQMSGMIDTLHSTREGSLQLSDNDVSWIASLINVICFCGFGCVAALTEIVGRRKSIIIFTLPVILSWIMVYLAEDTTTLVISRVIVGISFGGVILTAYICVGEYVLPKTRPLCLNIIYAVGTNVGTMLGHILSTFIHWRNVALIGIVPTTLSAILPFFWVESPFWLASKGRFKESERSFNFLHVINEASKKEIDSLINAQRNKESSHTSNSLFLLGKRFLEALKTKYFWKLFYLIFIISVYRVVAGRIFFSTFAITILQHITGTSDILIFTFLVDGFIILGAILSCFLVSKCGMRSLILKSGIIANIIQLLLSLSLFVWQNEKGYVVWIKVVLLALYFIVVNAGPYAVIDTLLTELFPLDIKALFFPIFAVLGGIKQFIFIKFTPSMFENIGYHGVFLINAVLTFGCLIYLYYYLPETKGKTLQEIEYYFKSNTFEFKDQHDKELQQLNFTEKKIN